MIRPLADRVVVLPVKEETVTKGGIHLADNAKERPSKGTVVAVGQGRYAENGTKIPMEVKVDDVVVYSKYAGEDYKEDEKEYKILNEKDILAII